MYSVTVAKPDYESTRVLCRRGRNELLTTRYSNLPLISLKSVGFGDTGGKAQLRHCSLTCLKLDFSASVGAN